MNSTLQSLDWIVLGGYFAILLGIAWWVMRQKNKTTEDYFLAGRNVGWFVIGASIFASNIGSEHVVGLAGTGAESGMPMAHYELHAWIVLLLGWFFLPFYMRSGAFTMPEFLEKRFDSRSRWFLSLFSIAGYVLTKVSVTIYAGGIVVSQLLGIGFFEGAIGIVIVTGLYTILGGMRAVVYTEAFQTIILLVGAAIITILGLQAVGGWAELKATAGSSHFNMWRPASDPEFPWTGMLIGGTIVGIWYWCTDQYIVQRTLAAHNIKIGRRGAIFGAYLKLTPIFIFLIPGIIAFALKKKGLITYERSDEVFPTMVRYLLPVGLKGLVAGGLMAALMSSLASVFNSASTLFTVDIFKKMYPDTPEEKLVKTGRIATAIIVVLGMLWIPIMQKIGGGVLYQYLQSVQAYIAPPITAVFLLGILWKRINAKGAIATLFFGLLMATVRIISELLYTDGGKLVEDATGPFAQLAIINFAHMAIYMFVACVVVCSVVSLYTEKPDFEKIKGLTLGTLSAEQKAEAKNSFSKWDVLISVLLVAVVISVLIYFRG
ncbi:MAG TPA: sodium:solute symporter [Chitinophagaceae bacterium]|nr:sodium:solute symporter [Chitinophagaceae bacterium]